MTANFLNARLVLRFGNDRLLNIGTGATALAGLFLAAAARTDAFGLWGLAVPRFLFVCGSGLIVANSIAGALTRFPDRAGAVSALIGALQYGCGIITSALVGVSRTARRGPWP